MSIDAKIDLALRKNNSGRFDWIVDNDYLKFVEADESVKEVWIISCDLAGDIEGGDFVGTVQANLKRGVKYVYFVPDSIEMKSRVMSLVAIHGDNNRNLDVRYLDSNFFFIVKDFDFIIYNPRLGPSLRRYGFMGLPVNIEYGRCTARISDDLVDVLVGRLSDFIEDFSRG